MASINKKPAWFDLSNYPDFNSFPIKREWGDESLWAYNFHIRSEIINAFENSIPIDATIKEKIALCQREGFLNNPFKAMTSGNVKPLTVKNIGDLYQSISIEEKKCIDKYNKKGKKKFDNEISTIFENGINKTTPSTKKELEILNTMEIIDKPYKNTTCSLNNIAHLSVNFNAPLNTLVAEFKDFIKEKKENSSIAHPAEVTAIKIKRWAEFQILAYMDLCIYSKEMKSDIKQKHYGDWLFPNESNVDTTEKVRKTVEGMVVKVLEPEFIKYIASQSRTNVL